MIKKYQPEDLELVRESLAQEGIDEGIKYFTSDHYTKYLCFKEKELAGWTILEKSGDRLIINWILAREKYRREGIGTQLMNKIKEHAQELGVRGISVNTGSQTTWARKFYEKNGFEEVGSVREYFAFDEKHIFYWYPIDK
ncbi:MAG: GNAT family N-acetyltransferase [Candidatus Woesearchaeota archaeon]